MAVVCAIVDFTQENHYAPLGAPWLYDDNLSNDNPRTNGAVTWAFALLTYALFYFRANEFTKLFIQVPRLGPNFTLSHYGSRPHGASDIHILRQGYCL